MGYVPVSGKKKRSSSYVPVTKKKVGIDWDRLTLRSAVDAAPSGFKTSTAPVWKPGMASTGEALQTPDVVSGLATSLPARGIAFAAKLPQPKVETFTEQTIKGFEGAGAGKAAPYLGFTAAMIGDPLNLIGGGASKATKLAKLLAKTEDANEVTKLLKAAGFDDDLIGKRVSIFTPEKDAGKIEKVLVRDMETMELANQAAKAKQLPVPEGLPKLPKAPSAKKITGQAPAAKVTRTAKESTLLKEKIKYQATGARAGFKAGVKEGEFLGVQTGFRQGRDIGVKTGAKWGRAFGAAEMEFKKGKIIDLLKNTAVSAERVKSAIVLHAKDALPPALQGKAITLVRDAKNRKDLGKAFARINNLAEESVKTELKNDIIKIQRTALESPSVAVDYKKMIEDLSSGFELKGHREDMIENLKKTRAFLQAEAAKGKDTEIPRKVLQSLELLNRTPLEKITISQMKGLKAEMELLRDLGKTKFRTQEALWEAKKAKIIEAVAEQAAPPLEKNPLLKPAIGEKLTASKKLSNFVTKAQNQALRLDKVIMPIDVWMDILDGGKGLYNGANYRFFKAQADAGYGRFLSRKEAVQEEVIRRATGYELKDTNFERMGVVAARDQDGGMEKLTGMGFTEAEVNAIKLTKEEQEVLDLMRKTFDDEFPAIEDVMRRVYNKPVEKVKNYFSFMSDFKAMDDMEVFERFGSQGPTFKKKNVEVGFTKSRTGGDQTIKINALDVFLKHTENTSYLLEMGETSKMLGEIAASPEYGELVGDAGQLLMREWIDVLARKGGASGATQIPGLDTLRRNVGAGILGLKLSTVAIQPTSLIDGASFIGAKYATKGATNFLTDPAWRQFVKKMPEVRDRMGGEFALRELTDDTLLQEIQRKGFIPMQTVDQMTAGMVAAGAYERKMAELGLEVDLAGKFNPEALAYAQLAVRRTQSSGSFKDVPLAVSRGAGFYDNRSYARAVLQFQNFLLNRWSRIRHDAIGVAITSKNPKLAAKAIIPILSTVILASAAVAGIRLGVNRAQDLITGREDEDSPSEDVLKSFTYEMLGNVPFMGTVMGMALYDGEMFPVLDAPKGVVSGLTRAVTSKSEAAKLRGITEFLGSTGSLLGVPGSAQAETLMRGALQDKKSPTRGKSLPTPPGLPKLPSLKSNLPKLPKLPNR